MNTAPPTPAAVPDAQSIAAPTSLTETLTVVSPPRRALPEGVSKAVKAVLGMLGIFAIWELIVRAFSIPSYLLVGPIAAFQKLGEQPGYFAHHAWVTVQEALAGFGLGVGLGIVCGAMLFYIPPVRHFLYPALIAVDTIPKVALAPLFIVWFGFGFESKVFVAMAIAFFPLVINTFDGLSAVPNELKELARINNASAWMRMRKIEFWYALPSIFSGAKISISLAVGGAVVGEFIAGTDGLGQVILRANAQSDLATMFAAFMVLAAISLALFYLITLLSQRLLPWRNHVK